MNEWILINNFIHLQFKSRFRSVLIPKVLLQESMRMCKDGKNGEWFGSATFVYNRARSS